MAHFEYSLLPLLICYSSLTEGSGAECVKKAVYMYYGIVEKNEREIL